MDGQLINGTAPDAQDDYVRLASRGKNEWWRYLIALVIILVLWMVWGSLPYTVVLLTRLETQPLIAFIAMMMSFWFLIAGIWGAVVLIHRRPFKTLITPRPRLDWKRILQGFGAWFVLNIVTTLVDYLVRPGFYTYTFNPLQWLPFVALALILIPIQTTAEELFFRGYLMQGLGRFLHTKVALVILSGFFFMLPHLLNPEMVSGFALMTSYYFLTGAFLALITVMDNRLELALGVHAANNLFAGLAVNYEGSVLATPSIFLVTEMDALSNLLSFIVQAAAVLILFFVWRKRMESRG